MNLRIVFWSLLALTVIGCSNDDRGNEMVAETSAVSFVAIGEDAERVYQFDYNSDSELGENIDLTSELGVFPSYLTLRERDDVLSFYSFSRGSFSLAQKNILTGAISSYIDFYTADLERSIAWGINTEERVFFGYFGPQSSRNLAVLDFQLDDASITDVTIDFNIDTVFQPLLFENKVFIAYRDGQGNYKLTYYNIDSKGVGPVLDFGPTSISFLIAESGDVAVIKNGSEATLELYDTDSLTFIESLVLDFSSGFNSGPVDGAVFSGNRLFYQIAYPQPARIPYGPAIYDFGSQTNQFIDVFGLIEDVEQELGTSIGLTAQIFDAENNIFFMGYAALGNEVKGGILQISTDGSLIANIEVPFFPTHIFQD